jgi:PPOX class probable F420-dependent enzyme
MHLSWWPTRSFAAESEEARASAEALAPAAKVVSMLDTIDPEILANDTAVIATISPAGVPQLTAVWYVIQDGHVRVSINRKRQKGRNLQKNPNVSLLIYHPETQNYFAEIRGQATLIADDDYQLSDVIAKRYNADFRAFDQPGDGRWLIDIAPTRVVITDVRH